MKEHRLSNNHPMLSMILALLLSTILVDTITVCGLLFGSTLFGTTHRTSYSDFLTAEEFPIIQYSNLRRHLHNQDYFMMSDLA